MKIKLLLVFLSGLLSIVFSPAFAAERYEVTLTKHITLYQEYPKQAKENKIEGDAIIRIRVSKNGKILGYALTKNPGNTALEKAIRDMVKKANPAPKPPADVLDGKDFADFMLPIAFRLDNNPESLIPIDRLFQQQVRDAWKDAPEEESKKQGIGEDAVGEPE